MVKELQLALSLNYKVSVICFEFDNWSKQLNEEIKSRFSDIEFYCIDAGRKNILNWFSSVAKEKVYRLICKYYPLSNAMLSQAISRRSNLIINQIKKIEEADLVIGHNPGAIYPSLFAAQRFNCKVGFDVEDYHPGEGNNIYLHHLTLTLMKNFLPKFNYVSFASFSIYNKCKTSIANLNNLKTLVINNSFSQNEFIEPNNTNNGKLKLVWFSQQIDKGRGLEHVIPIVNKHNDLMSLTLFGNLNPDFKKDFIDGKSGIHLGGLLPQKQLHQQLSHFDIGLAIEPGKDLNNELALSNKVFAYLQAGLFVLATDTIEQKRLIEGMQSQGELFKKNFEDVEKVLSQLHQNIDNIRSNRINRFHVSKSISWENTCSDLGLIWTSLKIS